MNKKTKSKFEKTTSRFFMGVLKPLLLFIIVCFGTHVYAANVYSQSTNMSVKLNNVKIEALFSEIEKKSDYVILYKKSIVENKTVSVNSQDETAEEILDKALPAVGLAYHVNGNQIVVVENNSAIKTMETQEVQQTTIQARGNVYDSRNESLIGVSVVEKANPSNGVATGLDGDFSLNVQPGATLVISYLGYTTREIQVPADGNVGSIIMVEDSQLLDDVVVIGYGVQKKANLTGAVASINVSEIENRANPNVLASLQGKTPGVTIISRPGAEPSINIRGRGNLGTSSPLYIIDGAISDGTFFSNLDPNSIENISILKDAASASIYGSRAAYGVILVTTKKGTNKKLSISYDGFVGWKSPTNTPDILSSEWYAILQNEAARNENPNLAEENLPYSQQVIQNLRNGTNPDLYPNTDWWDLVFRDNATITRHSLSFSGGSDEISYFSSFGYMYDEAFQKGQSTDRYNFATNITANAKEWLTLRTGIKFMQDKLDRSTGSISHQYLLQQPTTMVAKQSDGNWGSVDAGSKASSTYIKRNPLRVLEEGGWRERVRKKTMYDFAVDIKPFKDLIVTGQMIYDNMDYKDKTYEAWMPGVPDFLEESKPILPSTNIPQAESKMTYDWREQSHMTYNALANYTWTNNVHSFGVLGGMSYEYYKFQKSKSERLNFSSNSMVDINGGSGASGDMKNEGEYWENKMLSYFGRLTYNYKERYLFEANMRADASSRFHSDERWGYFPSFSAGWRISEEDFMKDVHWADNIKLRASWGKLGNINNVGYYDYFSAYASGSNYNFNDNIVSGMYEQKVPNPFLSWEKVTITDVGLDLDLFGSRLNIVADYFYKKTDDMLLRYNVAREIGTSSDDRYRPSQNIATLDNKGFEFGLSHNNRIGDFSYTIGGNFSYIKNELTDMGDSDGMISDERWIYKVGQPVGTFYGWKTDGLLTQEDIDNGNYITDGLTPNAGDIKYVDLDGDGRLTESDKTYIGCDVPEFTYGVNLNLAYKDFALDAFGQGVTGTKVYLYMENAWAFSDNANPRKYHLKRWTVDNPDPNAAYPRIYSRTNSHSTFNQKNYSDFWLYSANYFRIKNITLTYNVNKNFIRNWGIQGMKLYFSMENPFTFRGDKRMEDFDPESSSGRGVAVNGTKSYTFGLNLTF